MIVVKFGGHAMVDETGNFAKAIEAAQKMGETVVVVHGGGPQIDQALEKAGITSEFVGGFRVTSPEVFAVVEAVLTEEVGPNVAHTLNTFGIKAKAISGRTLPTFVSRKRTFLVDGTTADLGLVGDVVSVDASEILALVDSNIVPVVAPISADIDSDNGLNVNADLAAAALAGALGASALIIMTDVPGIYRQWPDKASLIEVISSTELSEIKNIFAQGMAPKVQSALDAIANGAKAVRIIDGTDPESFAAALAGTGGTLVVA
ncbi:MAG: acetylglutamate kinase [Actinobacteria bacterium]|jgi:acetylglutamate kinase|nr:acetylglutamate kinase [Actinomycetota bacterium]